MSTIYKNKFSIGLSLDIELDEYKKLIDNYNESLYGIYFSPPIGRNAHSRAMIADQLENPQNIDKLDKIIELFYQNGYVIDADLNVNQADESILEKFIEFCMKDPRITEVTTLLKFGDEIHKNLQGIKMNYSFNNFYSGEDIPYYFRTLVLGRKYIRDIKSINEIIKSGKRVKLLLNNGCSFFCGTCNSGSKQCTQLLLKNVNNTSPEYVYALQTLFPWELYELYSRVEEKEKLLFKISNRVNDYTYINKCLKTYIDFQCVKPYVDDFWQNYYLWCRVGGLHDFFKDLNIDIIEQYKCKFWNEN